MTSFLRQPSEARLRDVLLALVAAFGLSARRRWLPLAGIASAIGGVVFAAWLFSTLAT